MSNSKVSGIYIYPIKSTSGINLPTGEVDALGLVNDRRFVLSDPSGQFITARTEPLLCLVKTKLGTHGLELTAPGMSTLTLNPQAFSDDYQMVTVWGDEVSGQVCSAQANAWFSEYLKRPCQLLYFGQNSYRERKANTDNARKLAFADGYPLLLIAKASLETLNQRLENNQQSGVSMAQFRPNIVVDNCLPFAEDGWQHIRIGEVEFKVSKPCERCVFTTVNPKTGRKDPQQQPLQTLKSFRQNELGEVFFGQNLIPLTSGEINLGDPVTILSRQAPPVFNATLPEPSINSVENIKPVSQQKKITVTFDKWGKQQSFQTKDEKTLLEQGEEAGLILPYSCRAGMCGRCKAKLITGNVTQSATDGLTPEEQQQGYILCCSSIANTDVVIKHD